MLVMRTVEDPTDPIGKLVSTKQSIRLNHFALAVNPLGLYGVKLRTLLGKKAAYDPHSAAAPFDLLGLCFPSHLLSWRLMCQLALSQMRTNTFLPAASSFSQHHQRN
jgi:hypothetical protein